MPFYFEMEIQNNENLFNNNFEAVDGNGLFLEEWNRCFEVIIVVLFLVETQDCYLRLLVVLFGSFVSIS